MKCKYCGECSHTEEECPVYREWWERRIMEMEEMNDRIIEYARMNDGAEK